MEEFKFDPVDGWEDASGFPTNPDDETATRTLFQKLYNQIRDFINTKIVAGHNAHLAESVTQKEVHGLKIETGSWTPTIWGDAVAGDHAYSFQKGTYYKIGGLITIDFLVGISNKDDNMSGNVRIGGIPSVIRTELQFSSVLRYSFVNLPEGYTSVAAYNTDNANTLTLVRNGAGKANAHIQPNEIVTSTYFSGSITYKTN